MSRVADHAQRRRQVMEATMRVLAAKGMDGVKVAEVAHEAGVSAGLVQRYFRTKDEMLLTTCEYVAVQLTERLIKANEAGGSARERLRCCLAELLPLDERRTAEVRIYLAFCGRAVDVAALRSVQAETGRMMRSELVSALSEARELGELAAIGDLELEAATIWSLVDGIAMQSYFDPEGFPAATGLALLDAHLDRLFI